MIFKLTVILEIYEIVFFKFCNFTIFKILKIFKTKINIHKIENSHNYKLINMTRQLFVKTFFVPFSLNPQDS
jgi:hypothetical protein